VFIELEPPLVPKNLIINTDLITNVETSENKQLQGFSAVTGSLQANVRLKNGNASNTVGKVVTLKAQPTYSSTYYINIFMRDPLFNLSHNNKTFNNRVVLSFSVKNDRDAYYQNLVSLLVNPGTS